MKAPKKEEKKNYMVVLVDKPYVELRELNVPVGVALSLGKGSKLRSAGRIVAWTVDQRAV